MKPGQSETAIELMRILALAGSSRLNDPAVVNALVNSKFYQQYQAEIETDPQAIGRDLSPSGAKNRRNGSMKFYPLPFFHASHIECVLFRPHFFSGWDASKVEIIQIGCAPDHAELGYRIERGHHGDVDRHGYLHVQMAANFHQGIQLAIPAGLSTKHPAFPINDTQPYAPVYAAMIAFTGLQKDWNGGLANELKNLQQYGNSANFNHIVASVKTTCHAMFFNRGKNVQSKIAGRIGLWLAKLQRNP